MTNQALSVILQSSFKHGMTLLRLTSAATPLRLAPATTLLRVTPDKCQVWSLLNSDTLLNSQILSKRYWHSRRLLMSESEDIESLIQLHMPKIEVIAKALQCSQDDVIGLVRKDTRIVEGHNLSNLLYRIEILQRYGFSWHEIIHYPHVFNVGIANLADRLNKMDELKVIKMHLLICNRNNFHRSLEKHVRKIKGIGEFKLRFLQAFIGRLFQLDESEVLKLIERYPSIKMRRKSSLTKSVHMYLNNGYSMDEVIVKLDNVLLTVDYLPRNVKTAYAANQRVLDGYSTKQKYLQFRLQRTEAEILQLLVNQPGIAKTRPVRLKGHLDMLLGDMELTPRHVYHNPHLLIYSEHRTRQRFQTLKDLNMNLSTGELISALIINNSDFERKYESRKYFRHIT